MTDRVSLDLPAQHRYLNVLTAGIAEMLARVDAIAERETVVYGIQLACQEICTNLVDHAYGGQPGRILVDLSLEAQPRRLVVDIRDTSTSHFDPTTVPEPSFEAEELSLRGRGLLLIRQLVDEASYTPHNAPVRYLSAQAGPWQRQALQQPADRQHNLWRLVKAL